MTSTQVTIRIPDELVQGADRLVAEGVCANRTAAIVEALRRMLKAAEDEREIAILKEIATNPSEDEKSWSDWIAKRTPELWADLE